MVNIAYTTSGQNTGTASLVTLNLPQLWTKFSVLARVKSSTYLTRTRQQIRHVSTWTRTWTISTLQPKFNANLWLTLKVLIRPSVSWARSNQSQIRQLITNSWRSPPRKWEMIILNKIRRLKGSRNHQSCYRATTRKPSSCSRWSLKSSKKRSRLIWHALRSGPPRSNMKSRLSKQTSRKNRSTQTKYARRILVKTLLATTSKLTPKASWLRRAAGSP